MMQIQSLRLAIFLLLFPSYAFAAENFGQSMSRVNFLSWVGWGLLSTLIGMTSLLNRIVRELRSTGSVAQWQWFVAAHMTGSWSAGLIALFIGEYSGAPGFATALGMIAFSFGGASFLQKWSDQYLSRITGEQATKT
jgi:multisubunit Na+/H+ antiporter MnhB subunit